MPSVTIMSIADVDLVQAGVGREGSMARSDSRSIQACLA